MGRGVQQAVGAEKRWRSPREIGNNVDSFGPENIVLDKDVAPSGGYHIGVLNFSGAVGRVATVKIYCGSTGAPGIYNSHPLQNSEFWVVGTIDSDTCNFSEINDYR